MTTNYFDGIKVGKNTKVADIKGYEGRYSITSDGRIIAHPFWRIKKYFLRKLSVDGYGYKHLTLHSGSKRKTFRVCRLVAIAFIPNPKNLPQVNHIDKNRSNDNCKNLEWVTPYENYIHSRPNGEVPVHQYTMDGRFIRSYKSANEASRISGARSGAIRNCVKNRTKSAGGFRWIKKELQPPKPKLNG